MKQAVAAKRKQDSINQASENLVSSVTAARSQCVTSNNSWTQTAGGAHADQNKTA